MRLIQAAISSALETVAERQIELDVLRAEDDRLFPGRAALRIGQVVDLVEDDAVDVVEIPGGLQQHVAQHLGRHHDDRGRRGSR